MKRIWAPWRYSYIKRLSKGSCIFCQKGKSSSDSKNYILKRSRYSFIILNIFPYNNGHLMVAPNRHVKSTSSLNPQERLDLFNMIDEACRLLDKTMRPMGYNIGINMGRAAGAGYAGHLHVHIVPRWNGDTNFMPVIAQTKVLPESLNSVYKRLKKCLLEKNSKSNKKNI